MKKHKIDDEDVKKIVLLYLSKLYITDGITEEAKLKITELIKFLV